MVLFRFEAVLEKKTVFVVVASETEEKAFQLAEREIERNYLKLPIIKELSLVEKKTIGSGTGFVVDMNE
ncbi:DUF3906 family protein [Bacillus sp. FJAT-45350]|uniref:DUF3906 family protein n=1 Tax=Bacillus sp. FJAT-45350 TaxID=2011014 RepID=UPI000BB71A12|nr:DUF3906 family protein [Bacillus sp. FJAT-45350]